MITLRITHMDPLPDQIQDWLDDHDHHSEVWRGKASQNFWVNDITFKDENFAIEFKLRFGEIVYTAEEVIISDAPFSNGRERHTYGVEKSWLHDLSVEKMKAFR